MSIARGGPCARIRQVELRPVGGGGVFRLGRRVMARFIDFRIFVKRSKQVVVVVLESGGGRCWLAQGGARRAS